MLNPEKPEIQPPKYKVTDRIISGLIHTVLVTVAVAEFGIKDGLEYINSREALVGMIEGGIIAPKLAYPDPENGNLVYKQAAVGQWIGYDPNRRKEFPSEVRKGGIDIVREGVLWAMLPAVLKGRDANTKTPTSYVQPFYIENLLTVDHYSLETLIGEKVLRATTLAEAYDRVGLAEHIPDLESRSFAKDQVYQVTPKGNTLIHLMPDHGDKTPKPEARFKEVDVPGLLTA